MRFVNLTRNQRVNHKPSSGYSQKLEELSCLLSLLFDSKCPQPVKDESVDRRRQKRNRFKGRERSIELRIRCNRRKMLQLPQPYRLRERPVKTFIQNHMQSPVQKRARSADDREFHKLTDRLVRSQRSHSFAQCRHPPVVIAATLSAAHTKTTPYSHGSRIKSTSGFPPPSS